MADEPQVLAFVAQNLLQMARQLPEEQWRRIEPQLDAEIVAKIESALRINWIPVAWLNHVNCAVARETDRDDYRELWRQLQGNNHKTPVFSTLVRSALAIFGATPLSLCRISPKGFQLIFKNCGTLTYAPRSEHDCTLTYDGYPLGDLPELTVVGFEGAQASYFDFTPGDGEVTSSLVDAARGHFELRVHWDPPASP